MKWVVDPSYYKAAADSLNKCSIRRIKHLAAGFVPILRRNGLRDHRGLGRARRRGIISRWGLGEADKTLKPKRIVQGSPSVGKHGMDRHEDPAPTRSQPGLLDQVRGAPRRHPAAALQLQHPHRAGQRRLDPTVHPVPREAASGGGEGCVRGDRLTMLPDRLGGTRPVHRRFSPRRNPAEYK